MPLSKEKLEAIATSMVNGRHSSSAVNAGCTYLGQLISHDIVAPTSTLLSSRPVTPFLNLDSIYGNASSYQFEFEPGSLPFFNEDGFFTFSYTDFGMPEFRRNQQGNAIIPEQRNDQNQIISQLHVLWQQIHNKILLDRRYAQNCLEAKKYTTLLFQIITIEDFLFDILPKKVYQHFFEQNRTVFNWQKTRIPDFFSQASFRFGHSLIRKKYKLHDGKFIDFSELLNRGKERGLTLQHLVNWRTFFGPNQTAQRTLAFDTNIVNAMANIPPQKPTTGDDVHIGKKTMLTGLLSNLYSGYEMFDMIQSMKLIELSELDVLPVQSTENTAFGPQVDFPISELPLWPYLLAEAEQQSFGARLGPMGGILNAEVLRYSIEGAEYSVYKAGHYDFDDAMDKLGDLGTRLFALKHLSTAHDQPKKMSMTVLLDFLE